MNKSLKTGLKIHKGKTKFMTNIDITDTVPKSGTEIEKVTTYKYLGQTIAMDNRIIIRQRTRVENIVQYVTNTKWKWAEHIAHVADNSWLIRSTEWQIKGVISVGRDDIVGQQAAVWTRIAEDRERWRTLVKGYFLQWKDTTYDRLE